jgi:spore coat polysaccharide biosynthesis protein SpsF
MKNALIRCDASQNTGLGHITRCLALATQLKKQKYKVVFASNSDPIAKEKIFEQKFEGFFFDHEDIDSQIMIEQILQKYKIDLLICDTKNNFPVFLIQIMKKMGILTVALDTPHAYAKECDLVFFPPHAIVDTTLYKGKVYLGLEYVILRSEFYDPFERKRNLIPNILIMMGGTDPNNKTLQILKKIDSIKSEFTLTILQSQQHPQFTTIQNFQSFHKKQVFSNVANMSKFLETIDLAIIQFGTSVYELLQKAIPTIILKSSHDEKLIDNYFVKNNFCFYLDEDGINKEIIVNALSSNLHQIHLSQNDVVDTIQSA